MTRFLRTLFKGILAILIYWLSLMLSLAIFHQFKILNLGKESLAFGIGLAVGVILFIKYRFNIIYVFGHEATHWITAKLFLKDTGRFHITSTKGSVEVKDTNIWITLAPYIIPFYLLLSISLFGILRLCLPQIPNWGELTFAAIAGIAYAYHVVLTICVLKTSQSDLKEYGSFLSLAFILTGNLLIILLAQLALTSQWQKTWEFLLTSLHHQQNWLLYILDKLK